MTAAAQLARCDREIASMQDQHDAPAWLVTLGICDWELERGLIAGTHIDEQPSGGARL